MTNNYLKITCIIHSLPIGGMERVMSILLNDFSARNGVRVDLILIGRERNVVFDLNDSVRIHRPDFKFDNNKRNYHTLKTLIFLKKTVKEIQPDTILSFGEMWNNLVLIALSGLKSPVFISDRSQPDKNLGRLHNILRNKFYPKAAGFIAQTKYAAQNAARNNWNDNIIVIGNPIRQVEHKVPEKKDKILLSVGRLIRTKHFDDLIRVFAALDVPDWKLIIIGGNAKNIDMLSPLKQLVKDLDVEERIELTGEIRNVEEYYRKASLFVFPSSSEGFPNVIGEALSHNLPVVAYNCVAGPADLIIPEKNGFLVETHDHKDLAEKLRLLMEDDSLRDEFSKRAPGSVSRFSEKEIANQFFKFITQ